MTAGYVEFEFDLPGALLARLVATLDAMQRAPLKTDILDKIPETQGVYQIFLDEQLVYIGKTDAEAGLCQRLRRHHRKTQHRIGLDTARLSFKAVRIYVFTAVDLETQLINHYGGRSKVVWNGSGFGSNDPGRERDTTKYKNEHFDLKYPIDIDLEIAMKRATSKVADDILAALKEALPYVFRYQSAGKKSRKAHADLCTTKVSIPSRGPYTTRSVTINVVSQLPRGWQATLLPSHVILYKEKKKYPHGRVISRSK